MNKFVIFVFVAVFLKGIQSKSKTPKTPSLNPVPYYELDQHHLIKGEIGTGKIQTDDVILYENNADIKTGKINVRSTRGHHLYVNDLMILDQNPKEAPIMIPNPHLKCENVSSFSVDFDPKENFITYTIKPVS